MVVPRSSGLRIKMSDLRRWYVVQTYASYEKRVEADLRQRIAAMNMQDKIFDVLVPTETRIVVKDGKVLYTDKEKDILFAIGEAMGPRNWNKRDNFYKTFARQAARIAALRNLAEAMSGLKVEHFSNFKEGIDKLRTTLIHNSKVFKLLEENARQVGNATFDEEGVCTIFMAVRISSHK